MEKISHELKELEQVLELAHVVSMNPFHSSEETLSQLSSLLELIKEKHKSIVIDLDSKIYYG